MTAHGRFPSGLADLLDPIPVSTFFSEHYGRRPVVVAERGSERAQQAFGLEDAAACIEALSLQQGPDYLVVKDGVDLPELFVRAKTRSDGLLSCLRHPALKWSWVATGVHRYMYALWVQAQALARDLSSEVFTNAYFTPEAARCFGLHTDSHDVLVWQLAGRKSWRVHAPGGEAAEPIVNHELDAGQVLYIPEGYPHVAEAGPETSSLHLTIGFYSRPSAVRRLMHRKLQEWASPVPHELLERLPPPDRGTGDAIGHAEVLSMIDAWRDWLDAELAKADPADRQSPPLAHALDPALVVSQVDRLNSQASGCRFILREPGRVTPPDPGSPADFIAGRPHVMAAMKQIGPDGTFDEATLMPGDARLGQALCRVLVAAGVARVLD